MSVPESALAIAQAAQDELAALRKADDIEAAYIEDAEISAARRLNGYEVLRGIERQLTRIADALAPRS